MLLEFDEDNIFIWRYGVVEDVILSFLDWFEDICKFVNCKIKNVDSFKKILKE